MTKSHPDGARAPRIILVGAGDRGRKVYGAWIAAHPGKARIVGVAEPLAWRREEVARRHDIPPSAVAAGWKELFASPPEAEACIVATRDDDHVGPALAALGAGLDVLLEKPMATTAEDSARLVEAARLAGRRLRVCHVLRYTHFFQAAKQAVASGALGRIIHISHAENVSYWHFAHSYVRGNWRNEGESSPLVLAKTCHDLDLIQWIGGGRVARVQSFGTTTHFRAHNAPPGAPDRCVGSARGICPHAADCLWFAPRLYEGGEDVLGAALRASNPLWRLAARTAISGSHLLGSLGRVLPAAASLAQWRQWPASVACDDPSPSAMARALAEGPYGRCVYRCDNDAPDHQVVSMEFEDGLTATMTVEGLSDSEGRWLRIEGSKATLVGDFGFAGERLELREHRSGKKKILRARGFSFVGHGGGDEGLMDSFVEGLSRPREEEEAPTSAAASLESHLIAFAADRSRREGRIVDMKEMRRLP
ncbi:MAG TPA: Gfo/Idh/MocA family oxidoreductase [Rectinemataceae bacterium]|nr:Gfo/Idh/MocA family oxidoreductase [Rectinemataceae bacterium]